jgi:hypothetical protein
MLRERDGKRWVGIPCTLQATADGRVLKDDNGKLLYWPIIKFASKEAANRFSDEVFALLEAHHPDAFDGGAR